MKRTKRKYTRKPKQDAPQSISSPIKEESSIIPQVVSATPYVKGFTFDDLPLSIRAQVENTIKMRKRLGLPDDSKERKALAIKYFRGDRPR